MPLLLSLGYEVYAPKRIPARIYEWSGSIDYTYDDTLTIPQTALELLNAHDFYEDRITQPIVSILNRYFGAAFCVFCPNLLEQITHHFKGRILLRAFGLDQSTSYGKLLNEEFSKGFSARLQEVCNRFWFSQAYPNLDEIEPELIKSRSITHPLGLPDSIFKHKNKWVGGINKILFFCSRITASPTYYGEIYKSFKQYFGNLPHIIAGNQPVPVDDSAVAGYQPRSVINEWLRTCAVMFYHSQEPRHLHYHPLEAIVFGMPLIYMKGGILEQLGGRAQLGACATFQEAKEKITRILNGDQAFIADIRKSQVAILEAFSLEYSYREWQKNFVSNVMAAKLTSDSVNKTIKTIGVFLPAGYRGATLAAAKNIAKMLHLGSHGANEAVKVIFSCIANYYNLAEDFGDLLELGISVRETVWKDLSKQQVELMHGFFERKYAAIHPTYTIPADGLSNFNECDFWLLVSDRMTKPLAALKPYGIVVYDYIQRYIPTIFPQDFNEVNFMATARGADFVLATTPATREDVIQYAGVSSHCVHLAPMEFNQPVCEPEFKEMERDYFIWATNTAPHKNHLLAIEALNIYYTKLNGKLAVVMAGTETESFAKLGSPYKTLTQIPYAKRVYNLIEERPIVKQHLQIMGNLNNSDYAVLLAAAKFLWHPAVVDNDTYAVIEAAYYGVPAVSSDHPQMRFIDERFKLNLNFCDASQPRHMAVQLKKMEEEHLVQRQKLPKKEFLEQFSYAKLAPEFWQLIRNLL